MRSAFALFSALALCSAALAQGTKADYARSDGLVNQLQNKVFRNSVTPHWLEGGKRMWYVVEVAPGKRESFIVDAHTGKKEAAFDPARLAKALSEKLGTPVTPANLGVSIVSFDGKGVVISSQGKRWMLDRSTYMLTEQKDGTGSGQSGTLTPFLPPRASGSGDEATLTLENKSDQTVDVYWMSTAGQRVKYFTLKPGESKQQHTYGGHVWVFSTTEGRTLAAYEATEGTCTAAFDGSSPNPATPPRRPNGNSPDGKWRAIFRESNLWLHPNSGGEDVRLSTDGKFADGYGPPAVWSPDGKYVVSERTEDGQQHKVNIVQSSPTDQLQPKMITLDYLKPGDKIPHPRIFLFDTATQRQIPLETDLTPNPWDFGSYHWSADSKELYFVYNQRGHQVLRLMAADVATGKVRTVTEETSPTFIDYQGKLWIEYLDKTGEALWASERSGYNHIYLVNLKTGQAKPVTQGSWMVRSVERVDPDKRQLLLRIMGRDPGQDPYHMHYARVNFDGTGFTPLTDGDGTHRIVWSPDAETYLDIYSRVDMAPVTELRRTRDGKLLTLLEKGDDTALKASGWNAPERFVAKGRDGKTDIYGIILKPTNFDPAKKYPVIESVYAGPQDFFVPKSFSPYRPTGKVAELGFIVVQIDGMGTDWRGKAFHDVCFQNLADAGFPDRILWMKAAAATRPWMDLSRVGVYGTSAGGQSAASAVMRFGDFYKAAVADCGCHDNRMDKIWWNELWMGWPIGPSYEANSNVTVAKNLQGKLFLMVGEVDSNVDPTSTMQVVNALIRAGKDFDLLVVPNSNHGVLGQPYPFRRMEDFFVRNLYGVEPRR